MAHQVQREQNKYDNDFHDKAQDSIVNFETVEYFTAEKYEADRYLTSVANMRARSAIPWQACTC